MTGSSGGGGPTATDERLNRAFNDWQAVSHTAAFGRWQTFAAGWNAAVVAERERADTAEQLIARQLGKCIGCRYDEGPDEFCPQHGRPYDDMLDNGERIITTARAERDEALARVSAAEAERDEADHVCRVTGEKLTAVREQRDAAEAALTRAKAEVLAEATRRIEALAPKERRWLGPHDPGINSRAWLKAARAAVAGLAGEVGQHD